MRTGCKNKESSLKYLTSGYRITVSIIATMWLILVAIPPADAQSGLRRLFTTPELRAELDRSRLQELQPGLEPVAPIANQPFVVAIAPSEGPAPDAIYAIGGSMRRSDGAYTIWINDVATNASELPANMELIEPFDQGRIQIRNPETGASFIVKPGQVLNLTQGELLESYEYRSRLAAEAQIRAAASAAANAATSGGRVAASNSTGNTTSDMTSDTTSDTTSNNTNTAIPGANIEAVTPVNPSAIELLEEAQRVRAILQ